MKAMIEKINKIKFEPLFVRFLTAWFMSCLASALKSSSIPSGKEFFSPGALKYIAVTSLLVFAVLNILYIKINSKIKTKLNYESIILLTVMIAYMSLCVLYDGKDFFSIALCIPTVICAFYTTEKNSNFFVSKTITDNALKKSVVVFFLLVFFTVCSIGVFRCLTFSSPNYDLGIFTNTLYNLKTKFIQYNTCERDELITHLQVHISPMLYLITPIYLIFPSAITLQVVQALLVSSTIVPVYLLCEKLSVSGKTTLAICFITAFYPALSTGTFYDFHENAFLTVLILWMIYFYEKKKYLPMFIFALMTLLVKEDASVYVAFFGLYLISRRRDRIKGVILLVSSVLYFVFCVIMINKFGFGAMTNRYSDYMKDPDSGLICVIGYVFTSPAYVLKNCFNEEKIHFILQIFAPLAFIPFITKKISRYILIGPFMLINLMPSYDYQHSINFQYVYGSIAFLIYLTVLNVSDMNGKYKSHALISGVCVTTIMFSAFVLPKYYYVQRYFARSDEFGEITSVLSAIPKEAEVTSTTFFVPYLANRDVIYEYEYTDKQTEYLVLDLRQEHIAKKEEQINSQIYECVKRHDNLVAVYKRKQVNVQ